MLKPFLVRSLFGAGIFAIFSLGSPAAAQEVGITEALPAVEMVISGKTITIARNQDQDARIDDEFAKTSRACPPFCIHPMQVAPGVVTLGELEVIDFLRDQVVSGKGVLIDSRLPEWNAKGTIPGAVNVPFATLAPENPYRVEILKALGAKPLADGTLDFSSVMSVAMFCNGPWCDQSPRAIRYLTEAGFPPEKLFYYRGGMQDWLLLGLTVVKPNIEG